MRDASAVWDSACLAHRQLLPLLYLFIIYETFYGRFFHCLTVLLIQKGSDSFLGRTDENSSSSSGYEKFSAMLNARSSNLMLRSRR